jgi:pimeloyl-ACP methyl ester carboxylesterase
MKLLTILLLLLVALMPSGATALRANEQKPRVAPLPEVEKRGTGPVKLLLIPCISCRWQAWEDFMARNLDRYTMYAVTLPGYGGTPAPDLPRDTEGAPWRDNALAALSQLIDRERLKDLTVIGHSWGSMVAVQLAARRPDAIVRLVNADGSIESTTWTPATRAERLAQARQVVETYGAKLQDAEEWRKFNAVALPPGETIDRAEVLRLLKRHGSFMATDRGVMLQYWRENPLIDLTGFLNQLRIPILDLKALRGKDQTQQRTQHLKDLQAAGAPAQVRTVFLYETRHVLMDHRPEEFDRLLADFIAGGKLPESIEAPGQTAPRPCETDVRHRQFDFWIGEWWVTTQPGRFMGVNRIERVEGGCLLQENWTDGHGETGRSMNFFDAVPGKWRQVWMSPTGGALELVGEFKDDAMRFVGERHDLNGKTVPTRLTFFKLGPDKVRQFAEHSSDGGKTWATSYDFLYTRKAAAK